MSGIEQTIRQAIKETSAKPQPDKPIRDTSSTKIKDAEVIAAVKKELDDIKQNRSAFERQWLINLAFLFGRHYFTIEQKPISGLDERIYWELKNMERKKKTRRVSNFILPLFRSLLSRMLMMKSTVTVEATTNSERDRSAAKVGNEVCEDFWQMVNKNNPLLCQDSSGMMLILKQLFTYILAMGSGFLHPYFNPHTKTSVYMAGKIVPDAQVGEVETEVIHNFDMFWDPLKRFCIRQRIMDVDWIKEKYGKEVVPEKISLEDYASKLINMMEGHYDPKIEHSAKVFEKWIFPCKKYSKGRLQVMTESELLKDVDMPPEYKGKIPFIKFDYMDFVLGIVPYAQGMIEPLISLQEEYNFTITRLAGYKKWMAGKVMIPRKSKISSKWDDEIGQLLFYNSGFGTPTYQNPPAPPAFLSQELERIRTDMEDISGVHDTSMGKVPQGVTSGRAIEYLQELDSSQMAPTLISIEQKLSYFMEMVVEIMEAKYTEARFVEITGDMYGQEVKAFKGADLKGHRRITIKLGTSLPHNKQARQDFIMELEKRGYISKDKARELLEFGDIEGVYHSLDETLQKEEIERMIKDGYEVIVEPWEDHAVHLKVLTDFMKTKDFFELPDEIKQKFKEHMQAHQDMLLGEAQAASAGEGQPPAPPAAPPMPPMPPMMPPAGGMI
jgi:hypothetical protein